MISPLLLLSLYNGAFADFSDIPQGHWAEGYVLKLVSEEIISGYADGTFKGDKKVSRYEIAKMISPIADLLKDVDKVRRGKEELKSDASLLFYSFKNPIDFKLSGSISQYLIYDNQSFESFSPIYSIKASLVKELGSLSQLEINLDTDGVFYKANNSNRLLDLFDVKAQSNIGTIKLLGIYGPGRLTNQANPTIPFGAVLDRPITSIASIFDIGTLSTVVGINFLNDPAWQTILVGSAGLSINKSTSLFITPKLITGNSSRNFEGVFTYLMKNKNIGLQCDLFSEASNMSDSNGYRVRLNGAGGGSIFNLSLVYFGSNCNTGGPFELFPLTIFNTPILNGFTGGSISVGRNISDKTMISANFELVGDKNFGVSQFSPGTFTSTSLSLKREAKDNIDLDIFYRNTSIPSQQIYVDRSLTSIGKTSVSTYGISITARL